jgi:hypothetical protein
MIELTLPKKGVESEIEQVVTLAKGGISNERDQAKLLRALPRPLRAGSGNGNR